MPIGAFACEVSGNAVRVEALLPPHCAPHSRLVRIAVEVLPANAVPPSLSDRSALQLRKSPGVAMLFDTDQLMLPTRVRVLREDSETIHSRWSEDIRASGGDRVVAEYELSSALPAGSTAAAAFIFEVTP